MCANYPGIKLEPALQRLKDKIEHLSSYAHVVHTTAKQVISRRGKNENADVCEMSKNEKCTCKACKTIVFHCQICKFVTFLLPSLWWLLKLPNKSWVTDVNKLNFQQYLLNVFFKVQLNEVKARGNIVLDLLHYHQALRTHRSNRSLTMLHKADISVLSFALFWLSFANARGKANI